MKENFLTFDLDCYPFDEEEYTNSTTLSNVDTLFHFSVQVIYLFQCCSSTQQLFHQLNNSFEHQQLIHSFQRCSVMEPFSWGMTATLTVFTLPIISGI